METNEERKMMEADVQGVSQATTVAVGSTPRQFAEEQQKLEEKAVENQAEDEVESHVDEAKELQDQRTRFRR